MASNYSFSFLLKPKERDKICRNCCVKVDVFFQERRVRRKYYCLHCEKLYSRSGMHFHKLSTTHPPGVIKDLENSFFENLGLHEMKVKKLVERKGVVWLKGTALIPTPRICPFAIPRQTLESVPPPQRRPRPNPSPRVVQPLETEK